MLMRSIGGSAVVLALVATACADAEAPIDPAAHQADIQEWVEWRYADLMQPDGWLSLVGLYWLEEGENTVGTASDSDLIFPEGSAPQRLGVITVAGGAATFEAAPGAGVTHEGEPVESMVVSATVEADAPVLAHESLLWHVMKRSDRLAVRLKDTESPLFESFDGIERFPVGPAWRVAARFEPYDPPKMVRVPNISGTVNDTPSPGAVVFRVDGRRYRMDVTDDNDEQGYFIIFGDRTNREETYGGGRYIWFPKPDNEGRTVVDFNKSYNPPCVFTPYATCPLPPSEHIMDVRVEAGEMAWHP